MTDQGDVPGGEKSAAKESFERVTGAFRRNRQAREEQRHAQDEADARESAEVAKEAAAEARESAENFALRLVNQFERLREERQEQLAAPEPVTAPKSVSRTDVPYGVELSAQWAWRFLVIVAAGYLIVRALGIVSIVVVPLVIALLIAALVSPIVNGLARIGLKRSISALFVVIGVLAAVIAMLSFAGTQVANGFTDLAGQTVKALDEIRDWLINGPFHASESQIDTWLNTVQTTVEDWAAAYASNPFSRVSEVGGVALDVFAGLFIVLFSTYFFCAEGERIWGWLVRLAPRAARSRMDSSGRVAWVSLTQFTRATVIVAAVDAIGIMIIAAALQVPFVAAIGVLVFLSSFVPLIGATVAGAVAVLVALVSQGPVTALLMLGGVILVQQLEAHGLQPFLLGRWVRVHPLGVILAVATGIVLGGVAGALVAVPLVAALNAVVNHLTATAPAQAQAPTSPPPPLPASGPTSPPPPSPGAGSA
ncbi:Predicted PurR-regulated permease PerM [Nocardioides sp. YR527]|uniref:AI-2E family transporter n=1 Tax=Nocardioides sp. YR527 TaxID=1881028 RepID=UPI00089088FC|nr:AI-2E family transporter [Nocardioides sp. YR527]SDK95215.1 Predicted PurR-regulated permease PerM [Nocardioides sp. YR527]